MRQTKPLEIKPPEIIGRYKVLTWFCEILYFTPWRVVIIAPPWYTKKVK